MDLKIFHQLLSAQGQKLLVETAGLAPTPAAYLRCFQQLHKSYPADLVHAALDTVLLRHKARGKFSQADSMYFTREALEQSTGEIVAAYRARRYRDFQTVGDFGCGIGGDTIGLASTARVVAVDSDVLRLGMAAENVAAYHRQEMAVFREADLPRLPMPDVQAIFFDPARRQEGKRYLSVANYLPPLDIIHTWLPHVPAVGVKIAPGVVLSELAAYDAEVEFISVDGELKECVLWFGPLKTAAQQATILRNQAGVHASACCTLKRELQPIPPAPLSEPRRYLYEPDPAILRAGLVALLSQQLDACQIDADIAYLTSDKLTETPFAQAYIIEEAFPFHLKKLREELRRRQVGHVIVKKRGSPIEPDVLIKKLKLKGAESRFIFLTRVLGKPFVLIGSRGTSFY